MKIKGFAVYNELKRGYLSDKTAVMLDALRASATIITAVANGCDRIIPAAEATEAVAIKKISSEENVLLCGEIAAQRVSGFDLGNSPLEYTTEAIEDKVLIYSSTNGSSAVRSMSAAEYVLIGSFLNATAVAKKAYELGREIILIGAGTREDFSIDDFIALGCVVDRLQKIDKTLEMNDLCRLAYRDYSEMKTDLFAAMSGVAQFEYIKKLKMYDDLEYCLREDIYDIVPMYSEGVITK